MAFVETPEDEPPYFRHINTHGFQMASNLIDRAISPPLYYKHIERVGDYCAVESRNELGQWYVQYPGKRFWCVWDCRDFRMEYRPTTAERIVKERGERLTMAQSARWQTEFWANQAKRFGPHS